MPTKFRAVAFARPFFALVLVLIVSACSEEVVDLNAAKEQFCTDVETYVTALDQYGGLFEDQEITVGDLQSAADDLGPARDAVNESAQTFQEAAEAANPGDSVEVELVDPEIIAAVEDAEATFENASSGVRPNTPVVEAGARFTAAAYELQVQWTRLFAGAGCIEDEAAARAWLSDYVAALQTDLQTAGYYRGSVDGIYGELTVAAVEQLQTDAGLPVTGLMDPPTQAALAAILGQQQSAQVGSLQGILTATGYYSGPIDGVWSDELEAALIAAQEDLGVPATGVVDAATLAAFRAALEEAGAEPPPSTTTPAPPPTSAPGTTVPDRTTTTAEATTTTSAPAPAEGNLLEVLDEAGSFTQLLAAIDAAGLTEQLSGGGPFTLFAPTDEAFEALGELPTDPAALADVLNYHVVADDLDGFELAALDAVTTVQGGDIQVAVDSGSIVLNGASTVTISNVAASNGTAHVVNAVLQPPAG
jgi:uncharacterized surface protein with fasciclin (FAS1) repeats